MAIDNAVGWLIGRPEAVPAGLVGRFPELRGLRLRRGGFLPRAGGWCLGERTVDGITIGQTVWLGANTTATAELLLHECRHARQFQEQRAFPLRYLAESVRHGYRNNAYEVDARRFVAHRLAAEVPAPTLEDA